jgi:chromosomal replication initiation ATPase DnaA
MIYEISKKTGVPVELILGRSRVVGIVCVRQLYWKLLRERKRYTFREIAELNERDISTVQQGICRANGLLQAGDKMACELWNKLKGLE